MQRVIGRETDSDKQRAREQDGEMREKDRLKEVDTQRGIGRARDSQRALETSKRNRGREAEGERQREMTEEERSDK